MTTYATPVLKLRPVKDAVVLRVIDRPEMTAGRHGVRIHIPQTHKPGLEEGTIREAIVVAVGPGRVDERGLIPMPVVRGEKVIFRDTPQVSVPYTEDGQSFVIVPEHRVMAVIE